MNKICSKCNTEYPIEDFPFRDKSKGIYHKWCSECKSNYNKEYAAKNRDFLLKKNREYWKIYYKKNKELVNYRHRKNYLRNKEKWKPTRKKYMIENREKLYEAAKRRLSNPEKRKQRNLTSCIRDRIRRKTDVNYKLKKNLRCRVWSALKGIYKVKHTMELVGCSIEELKSYLQEKFKDGMTWNNYGKWHVDHIKPCTEFNLTDPMERSKCFHYTNLQPLWAIDNLIKNNKVV